VLHKIVPEDLDYHVSDNIQTSFKKFKNRISVVEKVIYCPLAG
jgi:hypothetical protein